MLTETTSFTQTTVTTYTYDAANRLTSVGDMAYTWDARGNLVNDGVFTYTTDAAGWLVRADSVTSTLVYTYNADGLRMAQSVEGEEIGFVWDLAAGLPQVLATSDGVLDLYGLSRIGEVRAGEWAYPLGDGLGCVRQWVDGDEYMSYAVGYTPFRMVLWQDGSAGSAWGYTGEWWDDSAGNMIRNQDSREVCQQIQALKSTRWISGPASQIASVADPRVTVQAPLHILAHEPVHQFAAVGLHKPAQSIQHEFIHVAEPANS
jgi:hypothetical protein